jgi:hypothetical protein
VRDVRRTPTGWRLVLARVGEAIHDALDPRTVGPPGAAVRKPHSRSKDAAERQQELSDVQRRRADYRRTVR